MCDQENPGDVALKTRAGGDPAELSDTSSLSDSDPDDSSARFDAEVENLSSSGDSSPDRAPLGERARPGPRKLPFQLQGGSAGFSTRSQSIFDCLESAAKLASPGLGEDNVIDGTFLRPMPLLPQRKRESAGSKPPPPAPPSSAAGPPQSPTHSPRWTKYSLEDVPDTSDRKNSQVALEYIQGLQQRRRESQAGDTPEPFVPAFNQDHSSGGRSKILFSRPGRLDEGAAGRDRAPEGGASRDRAPEGGASRDRAPEGAAAEGGKKKEVGLLHLEEPEEEPKSAQPPSGPRKRNCAPDEEDEGDAQQRSAVGFNSGRKVNRKKFRRGGEEEEEKEKEVEEK